MCLQVIREVAKDSKAALEAEKQKSKKAAESSGLDKFLAELQKKKKVRGSVAPFYPRGSPRCLTLSGAQGVLR